MRNTTTWKHIGSICFLFIITILFFLPQFQGKELVQGDQSKWKGMAQETIKYHEKTGNNVSWCGSMFSGMPGYTVSVRHNYPNAFNWIEAPFRALDYHTAGIILLALVCGYILFTTLECSIPISILGAFAFAFSSYFPIIIEAGHVTKGWVMATMPLVVAGLLLTMKKKWWIGGFLFTFALSENLRHGHIQVTYYLFILCLFIYIGYLVTMIKERNKSDLLKSTGTLLIGVTISIMFNASLLYSNLEMSKSSTRGQSELTSAVDGKTDKSTGLDRDYAFAWSYGKLETLSVLIPNIYGGASGGELGKDSHLSKAFKENGYQVPKPLRTNTYWGDQPFTSGPVYFGAIICFLFVLSLFIVTNKYKWWIVAASGFLIILSWGKNFAAINDFLFHYMPFYNKFRTPSMALVIPQLTFVWLACLALKVILDEKIENRKLLKSLIISAGITGGICLLLAISPSLFFDFTSSNDANYQFPDWYLSALIEDREYLLISDAWRSFIFIAIAFSLLFVSTKFKKKTLLNYSIISIVILCVFDLWNVDRRYLNEDHFVKKSKIKEFALTTADKYILNDKSLSYRVLTFNNPFNDTNVSYHHRSIGGYNAAKLRRYQDLIDLQIEPEMRALSLNLNAGIRTIEEADSIVTNTKTPILDMLNMKYLIINSDIPAATNHSANGSAWFIKNIQFVENADAEMTTLGQINPKEVAVVNRSFENIVNEGSYEIDSSSSITMTSYEPIHLKYKSNSTKDGVALFSEVYYPDWKAYIDGKEVSIFRANWILRGLKIPAGEHEIEFRHEATTYWNLSLLTSIISVLILICGVWIVCLQILNNKKKNENNFENTTSKHHESSVK